MADANNGLDLLGTTDNSSFCAFAKGTIREAYFGTDSKYNNGETVLLTVELEGCVDPDGELIVVGENEPGDMEIRWTIGKGFQESDGGSMAYMPGKPNHLFGTASMAGMIVANIGGSVEGYVSTDGGSQFVELLDGETDGSVVVDFGDLKQHLLSNWDGEGPLDPRNVDFWAGLEFTFRDIKISYGEIDGKEASTSRLLPVTWHAPGEAGKKKAAPKAKAKAKAKGSTPAEKIAAAKAEAAKEAAADSGEVSSAIAAAFDGTDGVDVAGVTEQVVDLLQANDDYDEFVNAVLGIVEVVTNDNMTAMLGMDDVLWASKNAA
tara:strand:+ start:801 stop:1760 length:960 start_codon:yes stop_codon:yes gene_type:complete